MRRGFRWRDVGAVAIGLKPLVLRVKVPRWLNTTTGEEFEQSPFVEADAKITRKLGCLHRGSGAIHDFERHRWLAVHKSKKPRRRSGLAEPSFTFSYSTFSEKRDAHLAVPNARPDQIDAQSKIERFTLRVPHRGRRRREAFSLNVVSC